MHYTTKPVLIELPDNIPGMVIEPIDCNIAIDDDFDI